MQRKDSERLLHTSSTRGSEVHRSFLLVLCNYKQVTNLLSCHYCTAFTELETKRLNEKKCIRGNKLKDPFPGVARGSAENVFLARRGEVPFQLQCYVCGLTSLI